MSKYRNIFNNPLDVSTLPYSLTRKFGDVPDIQQAHDIFVVDDNGYVTIKNPAPKTKLSPYIS